MTLCARVIKFFTLVISVPLLLVSLMLVLMSAARSPEGSFNGRKVTPDRGTRKYAVIFMWGVVGAGCMCFVLMGIWISCQLKPGLSAYAKDHKAAAESLQKLLEKAQNVVLKKLQRKTPVRVGATAGLIQLQGDASDRILQADYLKDKSTLNSKADSVTVLDGTQEGAYQWVTINYVLGNLGKRYSDTVGVVDLGGRSVQMAYAINEADAAKAQKIQNGEDTYVKEMYLKGVKYYLYVHSYLQYGLLATRAEILKAEDSDSPCIMMGYELLAFPMSGWKDLRCTLVIKRFGSVSYDPVWFGPVYEHLGAGFANLDLPVAKVKPIDFKNEAKRACQTKLEDAKSIYPHVDEEDLPYLCMALVYQYTLLGFGLDPGQKITLVKKVEYRNSLVEAVWPLHSAIEVVSSLK